VSENPLDNPIPVTERRRPRLLQWSWWSCWLRRALGALLVLLVGAVVLYLLHRHRLQQRLDETLAEMDREHPGWRLDEIEASRETVPDAENGALCVLAAGQHLPFNWDGSSLEEPLRWRPANRRLTPEHARDIEAELTARRAALAEASRLTNRETGRYKIQYEPDIISTRLPHANHARTVFRLFYLDAVLRMHKGDLKGAMSACRAGINAGRSLGDDPITICQLVRLSAAERGCRTVARLLAQGEPDPAELKSLQRLLEKEATFPRLEICARGERAGLHELFHAVESGVVSPAKAAGGSESWSDRLLGFYVRDRFREAHPQLFLLMNEVLEIAQLPPHLRAAAMQDWETEIKNIGKTPATLLLPAMQKVERADRRLLARLHVTIAAIASERYRRTHRDWPPSLDALCGWVPDSALVDPCTGEPLLFERLDDGLLIQSLGVGGMEDGGNLDNDGPVPPPIGEGVRLWDVNKRRQPPPAREDPLRPGDASR
jgi:hypothetical protein